MVQKFFSAAAPNIYYFQAVEYVRIRGEGYREVTIYGTTEVELDTRSSAMILNYDDFTNMNSYMISHYYFTLRPIDGAKTARLYIYSVYKVFLINGNESQNYQLKGNYPTPIVLISLIPYDYQFRNAESATITADGVTTSLTGSGDVFGQYFVTLEAKSIIIIPKKSNSGSSTHYPAYVDQYRMKTNKEYVNDDTNYYIIMPSKVAVPMTETQNILIFKKDAGLSSTITIHNPQQFVMKDQSSEEWVDLPNILIDASSLTVKARSGSEKLQLQYVINKVCDSLDIIMNPNGNSYYIEGISAGDTQKTYGLLLVSESPMNFDFYSKPFSLNPSIRDSNGFKIDQFQNAYFKFRDVYYAFISVTCPPNTEINDFFFGCQNMTSKNADPENSNKIIHPQNLEHKITSASSRSVEPYIFLTPDAKNVRNKVWLTDSFKKVGMRKEDKSFFIFLNPNDFVKEDGTSLDVIMKADENKFFSLKSKSGDKELIYYYVTITTEYADVLINKFDEEFVMLQSSKSFFIISSTSTDLIISSFGKKDITKTSDFYLLSTINFGGGIRKWIPAKIPEGHVSGLFSFDGIPSSLANYKLERVYLDRMMEITIYDTKTTVAIESDSSVILGFAKDYGVKFMNGSSVDKYISVDKIVDLFIPNGPKKIAVVAWKDSIVDIMVNKFDISQKYVATFHPIGYTVGEMGLFSYQIHSLNKFSVILEELEYHSFYKYPAYSAYTIENSDYPIKSGEWKSRLIILKDINSLVINKFNDDTPYNLRLSMIPLNFSNPDATNEGLYQISYKNVKGSNGFSTIPMPTTTPIPPRTAIPIRTQPPKTLPPIKPENQDPADVPETSSVTENPDSAQKDAKGSSPGMGAGAGVGLVIGLVVGGIAAGVTLFIIKKRINSNTDIVEDETPAV